MAKIIQKQVNDINSKCKNGFTFYIRGYMEAGRKQLIKSITLKEDEKTVEVELYWTEEIICQRTRTDATLRIARETLFQTFVSLSGANQNNRRYGAVKDSEISMSLKNILPQRK
ncbi:hypothetical protein SFC43_13520 [Bacteroides sp. CR5/BHMF/2]|nr:hypothetical protein [Bacteroides sp. CR5/BHMF/2]